MNNGLIALALVVMAVGVALLELFAGSGQKPPHQDSIPAHHESGHP
jgi:hypothetical protein